MNLEKLKKSIIVLDIETCASSSNGEPIDIGTNFEEYVKRAKVKFVGAYSYKYDKLVCDVVSGNEELIKNFIAEHDIIVGFNNEEFDVPILYNNNLMDDDKRFMQVDELIILGSSVYQRHDGLSFKNRGAYMGYKFPRNSLKEIAKTMQVETQKGDIDYTIFFKNEWTKEEYDDIIKYLSGDVMATKQIFDKLWDFWQPFVNYLDEKSVYNLSWIKSSIASLTYKCACNVIGTEPTYSDDSEKVKEEMGGRVIEPKYQESRNVWYVDFTSLYPHIFSMFNLFNETKNIFGAWHGNDIFKVRGYYNVDIQHPLSKDVAEKLKTRIALKKENPDNPEVYALKIFLNSLYGAVRSPIFEKVHTENAGWDCCWLGQQINEYTEKRLLDFGFETIAGDTDSVFVIKKDTNTDNSETYVKQCLKTIVKEIKDNVPFPVDTFDIDIENYLEYIMFPFSMQPIKDENGNNIKNEKNRLIKKLKGKKKNYLYLYKKDNELKLKIVGMPIIKDNATPLGKIILENELKPAILETKRAKFSKDYIQDLIKQYLSKPDNMKLFAVEWKVKPFISYKNPSQIQAQISQGYFDGQSGVAHLIKNKKCGNAGKGMKYCTMQEAIEHNLSMNDLDLTKLNNELEPFIERDIK